MIEDRTYTEDEQALLDLHRDWYYSNYNVNIPLMRTVFPNGDESFLMFNLNSFPYFGVDELEHLWRFYAKTGTFGLAEDKVFRVDVDGDMGYVASEGVFPHTYLRDEDGNDLAEPETIYIRFRSTEIYKRDAGDGTPKWTMWHFHCSPAPEADAVPIAKTAESTAEARGLGNTPYSSAYEPDYSVYDD